MSRTVAFDFDGVIHSYTSGWKDYGVIPDKPVKGIKKVLKSLYKRGYSIVVMSSRASTIEGRLAIRDYLEKNGVLKYIHSITCEKPAAFVTIDDRCICFDGNVDNLIEKIDNFRTYMEV